MPKVIRLAIHPYWYSNTVLLSQRRDNEVKEQYNIIEDLDIRGSGILLDHEIGVILVTAKHVIEGRNKLIYLYSKEIGSGFLDLEQTQKQLGSSWHFHNDNRIDIAITKTLAPHGGIGFKKKLWRSFSELQAGASTYILGFPLGFVPFDNLNPIIKKGIIARKIATTTFFPKSRLEKIEFPPKTILIDAFVDQANSGSPVVQEKELISYQYDFLPKRTLHEEGIIGIITGHFEAPDKNINAGLAICQSIDYVEDIIKKMN